MGFLTQALYSLRSLNEGRVAHISLVFREMWDTTHAYR
jgi:hypothetical protein